MLVDCCGGQAEPEKKEDTVQEDEGVRMVLMDPANDHHQNDHHGGSGNCF